MRRVHFKDVAKQSADQLAALTRHAHDRALNGSLVAMLTGR